MLDTRLYVLELVYVLHHIQELIFKLYLCKTKFYLFALRVARVPGKRWRKTSEEDLSEDSDNESSTSVIGAPMDDQLQNEAFGEGDDQYILPPINSNDPPKSFFAVARLFLCSVF